MSCNSIRGPVAPRQPGRTPAPCTLSREPPTVRGTWLLGSTRELLRDPLELGLRGYAEGGDVVRYAVGLPGRRREFFTVNHPDGVGELLNAPNHLNYRKDSEFYRAMRDLYGNGLVTSQDETWLRQRRFIQPLFTPQSVDGHVTTMVDGAERVAIRWHNCPSRLVDLGAEMTALTLGVAARILFGVQAPQMLPVLRTTLPVLGRAVLQRGVSAVRFPSAWPTPGNRRIARAESRLDGLCDAIIERRRAAAEPGVDLIGRLVAAQECGDALSTAEIRDQVKVFLLAGHDTTATMLTFALHLLGKNAGVQNRARDEAEQVLVGGTPTAADAHALTYTTMVLKEAARMYPPSPYLTRRAVEEREVCGYRIPAGADVNLAPWVVHHRADLWPEPFRFDPERFTPDSERERHKYAWFPFGHGPRGCIGQRFAMLEAAVALAILVREFEFCSLSDSVALTTDLLLHPAGEVPCRVRRRVPVRPANRHTDQWP
ncbi:Unspecific monooxygenase [Rhodococcus rhodochrous ATCC 21198]|uniref:cytochrome P450 n=1 Tax=Rhodococcus aetherivorans TaxID=191292 RepID=UPI0003E25E86|nr:cytochrome P450 [Rhodococcus aetherivorans]ETT27129.1 Unspecific monooxygenase [Rhodococcus rhodochrous ATCC 21198]NGP27715.1 cytochrome P450 [Rhodococcus aetherivorans]